MSGKKLMGIPIVVHPSNAEKNKVGNSSQTFLAAASTTYGPLRLYVGSLHFNIDEEMLRSIFKPYGVIEKVELVKDNETGRSRGYGFVTFSNPDNARRAQEQLNGFELAGRAMRVNTVNDRNDLLGAGLDTDEMDRSGVDLGSTGRLQLMAKLAEGTGVQVPKVRPPMPMGQLPQGSQSMHQPHIIQRQPIPIPLPSSTQFPPTNLAQTTTAPSQCFVLKNMFNPEQESGGNWDVEIRNETINALQTFGGAVHVFVDKNNEQGSVFVKCPDAISADSAIQALNGRYFAGRQIKAECIPVPNYHTIFPQAMSCNQRLSVGK